MLADELLDVALEPGLRPPALVVLTRDLDRPVGDLSEPPGGQSEQVAPFAADDRDDRAFSSADERHERRQVELPADVDLVRHRLDERTRTPDVVEPGREDREPLRAVAVELALEVLADPVEVGLQRNSLVVRQAAAVGSRVPFSLPEQRAHSSVGIAGRRHDARVEIEIQADRTALLSAELRQLAEPVPRHGFCHVPSLLAGKAAILRVGPSAFG